MNYYWHRNYTDEWMFQPFQRDVATGHCYLKIETLTIIVKMKQDPRTILV